jgi:hypothetical protein
MEFFNDRESSRKRKRTMTTYNIVNSLSLPAMVTRGDASMPGGTSVILPLLAELTEAASEEKKSRQNFSYLYLSLPLQAFPKFMSHASETRLNV